MILVTGGAGFIGAHVAKHLLDAGHQVLVVDDLSGGYEDNIPFGVSFRKASVLDADLIENIFKINNITHVFHLAAYAAEGLSHFIRNFNYTNNVVGSMNIINAAIKSETVERLVFTSSIAVYGAGQTPMIESLTPLPEDPYGIAKYAVELDLIAAQKMFGLDYTIFRPHNVYGELQNVADKYRNVIGIFMNQIMNGEPMTIFGDGSQTRAFTHINDVAPIIANSINVQEAANETFNIGADVPYSVYDLAHSVAKAMSVNPHIKYLPPRNEVVHAFSDHSKLHNIFGKQRAIALNTGLQRMAEWVQDVGARPPVSFDSIEVEKNLPESWRH